MIFLPLPQPPKNVFSGAAGEKNRFSGAAGEEKIDMMSMQAPVQYKRPGFSPSPPKIQQKFEGSGSDFRRPKKVARKKLQPFSTKFHQSIDLVESSSKTTLFTPIEVWTPPTQPYIFFEKQETGLFFRNNGGNRTFQKCPVLYQPCTISRPGWAERNLVEHL